MESRWSLYCKLRTDFPAFPDDHCYPNRRRRQKEDPIEKASDLAISGAELRALRRYLQEQISAEVQAFWRDYRSAERVMAEREQELAERRRRIERQHATRLLQRRRELPKIDWGNPPDFEEEPGRKVHQQNLDKLQRQFNEETLLDRLAPHIYQFASLVAIFERAVIPGLPRSEVFAHIERVARSIVELIVPSGSDDAPLPSEAKSARLSPQKTWAGKLIAGPFEILFDQEGRQVCYRRAPYAERSAPLEPFDLEAIRGLLRLVKKKRRLLRKTLKDRLVSDLVQMADDKRSRHQMVEECQERHARYGAQGVNHKSIAQAARFSQNDFYSWRADSPRIGPKRHRRLLFVLCSPIWPPPRL